MLLWILKISKIAVYLWRSKFKSRCKFAFPFSVVLYSACPSIMSYKLQPYNFWAVFKCFKCACVFFNKVVIINSLDSKNVIFIMVSLFIIMLLDDWFLKRIQMHKTQVIKYRSEELN